MEHCQWSINHMIGNENIYNTEILKSNLCDYNDCILLRGDIIIVRDNGTQVAFCNIH